MAKILHQQSLLPSSVSIGNIPCGTIVKQNQKYIMRVKPTQFLLNSTLVGDVLNRGDCFVTNVESGTLYIISKETPVELIDASLLIKEGE